MNLQCGTQGSLPKNTKAAHYVFLNEAIPELKKTGGVIFTDDASVDRHAVHELVGGMAIKFFKESLR